MQAVAAERLAILSGHSGSRPTGPLRAVAYRMLGSISEAEGALAAPRAHIVLRERVAILDSSC
jgi:hypothetical protein